MPKLVTFGVCVDPQEALRRAQGAAGRIQRGAVRLCGELHQEAREVRGAEKCRAGPLRREVLRSAGMPNGAAWSEALRRSSDGDAEVRAKHRAVRQHVDVRGSRVPS